MIIFLRNDIKSILRKLNTSSYIILLREKDVVFVNIKRTKHSITLFLYTLYNTYFGQVYKDTMSLAQGYYELQNSAAYNISCPQHTAIKMLLRKFRKRVTYKLLRLVYLNVNYANLLQL